MKNKAHTKPYNELLNNGQCGGSLNENDCEKSDLNSISDDLPALRLRTCPDCHEDKHLWEYANKIRQCKKCYNARSKLKKMKSGGYPMVGLSLGYARWSRRNQK